MVVFEILENIFNCNLSDFEDLHDEDFRIKIYDNILIGEIKGVKTNVKNEHVAQVENHRQRYLDKHEEINLKNTKPVLIINYQREKPPQDRDKIDQRQINLANNYGVLIIDFYSLLKVYEHYVSGNISPENLKNYFISHKGLLNYKDLI